MNRAVTGNGTINVVIDYSDHGITSAHITQEQHEPTGPDPFGGVEFLNEFFAGKVGEPPVLDITTTDFMSRVYERAMEIPMGEVATYGELARDLGTAPRAVGQAMKRNPVGIIVPCHRVVGASNIGGFSGYEGIGMKVYLLEFERGIASK